MTTAVSAQRPAPVLTGVQAIGLLAAIAGLALPFLVAFPSLSPAGHRMLGIFFMAIVLWITEVVPMHATATLIILLEVLMLSDKALLPAPAGYTPIASKSLFATLMDPVIILFLGGFFLADGATKFKLDKNLSRVILKPFGTRPAMVLMGLMLITAIFSMFMSNTATTATMMTVALPVMAQFPQRDRMRAALALAIPIAANIGGIGTPIGTPPNAIALGALSNAAAKNPELGIVVPTFLRWVIGAVPFMLVFLAIAWGLLLLLFRSKQTEVKLAFKEDGFDRSGSAVIFYATFIVTVGLWMTESLHGIDSNVVGFIPVVVLLCTRVFTVKDLKSLDWHVLWLVAGGIALGVGIGGTGTAKWFIGLFDWGGMRIGMLIAMVTLASLIMGTFMSHSATASLLVPIGIGLSRTPELAKTISPVAIAIFIAVGSSLAMALPISTPPNAIAFATGEVRTKDMAIVGGLIGIICWTIFVLAGPPVWRAVGIIP